MKRGNKTFVVVYAICMVVCVFFFIMKQDIGENALRDGMIMRIFFIVSGIACFGLAVYKIIDMIKSKGGYSFMEVISEIVFGLLFGIVITLAGVWGIFDCIKDMKEGYEIYYLRDAKIEYSLYQPRRRSFDTKKNYTLSGRCDGENVEYRVYNTDFPESLRDRINEENPDIVVYYYEHSNIIAQVQIHFASGVRVVPQGEKAIGGSDVNLLESESDVVGYEAPKSYEEVEVSEASNVVINVGDYCPEIEQKIQQNIGLESGTWYDRVDFISMDVSEREEISENIKTYFELTDEQYYALYKNSNGYVLVLIYSKTDLIIQEVRAFVEIK